MNQYPSIDFEAVKKVLPEERKAVIEQKLENIKRTREEILAAAKSEENQSRLKELSALEEQLTSELEALGGRTRDCLMENLQAFDLQNYWYGRAFDEAEIGIMKQVFDPGISKQLDLGSGTGRGSSLFFESRKRLGIDDHALKKHAQNHYAIDLTPRFVEATRKALAPFGVPPENVSQGDFIQLPEHLRKGQFDAVWITMNTLFYCKTSEELANTLKGIEESLRTGGIFLFDTVELKHHEGIPEQDVIRNFEDLEHFYSVLVRKYRQEFIDPKMKETGEISPVHRYPIKDRDTRGSRHYTREVISIDYLRHVFRGTNLHLLSEEPIQKYISAPDDSEYLKLANGWINEYEVENWLREEIAYRLSQEGQKTMIPLYNLPADERKMADCLDRHGPAVNRIFNNIKVAMGRNYGKLYYLLQKKS